MMLTSEFKNTFFYFLKKDRKIILAVSGGPDSMCLLYLTQRIFPKKQIIVAHFNHHIRPDSGKDQTLVQQFCKKHELVFELGEANIPLLAKSTKRTLEETGRIARYAFLRALKEKYKAKYILTAHHADDNVETILLHFIRGTGLQGLTGMKVVTNGIFRPLLAFSKKEILEFCRLHKVAYRIDSTNLKANTSRNVLRLKVLPLLRTINPQVERTLLRNTEQLGDIARYLASVGNLFLEKKTFFSQKEFAALDRAVQRVVLQSLYEKLYLSTEGLSFELVERIRHFCLSGKTGKQILFGPQARVKNDYGTIRFEIFHREEKPKSTALKIPGKTIFGQYSIVPKMTDKVTKNGIYLDYALTGKRLQIRTWQAGDSFIPLGMRGSKKLQDLFTDLKISRAEREQLPVVVDDQGHILAVYNLRIADKVKVTKKTKKILALRFEKLTAGAGF